MSSGAAVAELRAVRPDLVQPFLAALSPARSTVLGRLWGAFAREPLPGIVRRHWCRDALIITMASGERLVGPAFAAERFSQTRSDLTLVTPDGLVDDPPRLLSTLRLSTRGAQRLAKELDNSVVNLALARAAAGRHRMAINDSVDAEQVHLVVSRAPRAVTGVTWWA